MSGRHVLEAYRFAAMVTGSGPLFGRVNERRHRGNQEKLVEHPLELHMRKNGDLWKIVAVKDEPLATQIARKVGQEIVAIAVNGGVRKTADNLGVQNLTELLRQAEEILR